MEKNFSEQESLKVISEMIAKTKDNIQIGAANSMLFNGYFVSVLAIVNMILIYVLPNPNNSFMIWWLSIPMVIIGFIIDHKHDKSAIVRTPIDRIVDRTWKAFVVSIAIFLFSIFATVAIFDTWIFCALITPVILLFTGMAEYITGIACRFSPFIRGAYIFWGGALLCILSYAVLHTSQAVCFIILAICMVAGFILPGHILNRKAKKHV